MRHITYADKSVFVDDEAADCLLEYLTALSDAGASDVVRLRAIGTDGNEVEVSLFVNANTDLVSETATGRMTALENARAIEYMRRKIDLYRSPRPTQPSDDTPPAMGAL